MTTHEPQYVIRMYLGNRWYVLTDLKYSKSNRRMIPTWRKELSINDKRPYLYKTLVSARAGLDRYLLPTALLSEVVVWKEETDNVRT